MNILVNYNWLKEYVETRFSAKKMAQALSLSGPSVERVIDKSLGLADVVVGELKEIKKHPKADRLNISQIDIGQRTIQVVFGDVVKIKVGDKVPVAVAPTILPLGQKIKKVKLRGEISEGMICLESELGLSAKDELHHFAGEKPGTSLIKALDLGDSVLDVEITSNRPDNLAIIGLAREVAAITGGKFQEKIINKVKNLRFKLAAKKRKFLTVEVKDKKLCPRYTAIVMDNIEVKPSPKWLRARLISAGLRPLNNIVDITNYVMLEYGQPLHAFDYEKLGGGKILVRPAKKGEKILALNGERYKLEVQNLVIAARKVPVAVAGVMGGEESAVTEKTKTLVLEAATFDPSSVRKTARALNLYSESSYRFEKGLSTELVELGAKRAVQLIQELAGGKIASEFIDKRAQKFKAQKVKLNLKSIKRYLSIEISAQEIIKRLTSLGFRVQKQGKTAFNIEVPFWREHDVVIEEDIIEEVARLYGYWKLPAILPAGELNPEPVNPEFYWEDRVKEILAGAGLTEIYSYSFVSRDLLEKLHIEPDKCLRLMNPLNEDLEYMRVSLIPSVLKVVADNQKIRGSFKIFELAKVYIKSKAAKQRLPDEPLMLSGAVVAPVKHGLLFYEAKGILELMFEKMGLGEVKFKLLTAASYTWQAGRTANIEKNKITLGQVGEINSTVLRGFGITERRVVLFNLNFENLVKLAQTNKVYEPLGKFPAIELDIAMVLGKDVLWEEIRQTIFDLNLDLVRKVELFDVFEGGNVPAGKKSVAFRVTYRSAERTLESREAEEMQNQVIKEFEKKFGAKLRG